MLSSPHVGNVNFRHIVEFDLLKCSPRERTSEATARQYQLPMGEKTRIAPRGQTGPERLNLGLPHVARMLQTMKLDVVFHQYTLVSSVLTAIVQIANLLR